MEADRATAILAEFMAVNLDDKRRDDRLLRIVRTFCASPDKSFPDLMPHGGDLQAFYRFASNENVSFEALVDPHTRASASRVNGVKAPVLVIHDGTEYSFSFDEDLRDGFEQLGTKTQGFYGSVSLAIASDSHDPLGVLGSETWVKADLTFKWPNQTKNPKHKGHGAGRISGDRWMRFVERSEKHVSDPRNLIHVIDREADGFPLFAMLIASRRRFVIRVCGERMVELDDAANELVQLSDAAQRGESILALDVPISPRTKGQANRQHVAREARVAKLSFAAMPVTIYRASRVAKSFPESLTFNVVCVREVDPPKGADPIEWLIATTEPIETPEQVAAVVGYYKARWKIEEFFRALKTGTAFEKRQLESKAALLVVLAMSLVVAWHSMLLRHVSRTRPKDPASTVLPPLTLFVLRTVSPLPLKKNPSVQEALYAIAKLGGHIKNNGAPGITTLSRGMEKLLESVATTQRLLETIGGLATK